MNENTYPFTLAKSEFRYEFKSISSEKEVQKVVLITQTQTPQIFNLALVDILDDGTMSDVSVTNNDDLKTVLATVIKIIEDFLDKNKGCFVLFKGSDKRRQRLYRIVINREYSLIIQKFQLWGISNNDLVEFSKNQDMDFYLIGKK